MLEQGEEGIQAVGFFGNNWSVEDGEFEFRTTPARATFEELAPGQKRARRRPVPRERGR